jgi:hypothetical protein
MKFKAVIELHGKNKQPGIPVPDEVVRGLGGGNKPSVIVSIGHYSYRSTVATMGGQFLLPISTEHRKGAGVDAGDEVEVELVLDTEERVVEIPSDFAAALEQAANARQFFDKLSYSNKRRFVISIEESKTAETRNRRIDKAISLLSEGRTQ